MRQSLAGLRNSQESYLEWRIWHERIHRVIANAARNPMLLAVVDLICANTAAGLRQRMEQVYGNISLQEPTREHEAIVSALEDRDPPRAEALMQAYLLGMRKRLFGDR